MNPETWIRLGRALMFGKKPNYIIAFVTGRCNLKCGFCCHGAQESRKMGGNNELTTGQWAAMFSGLDALIHLTITGGEPFLREDLAELILETVKICKVPRISINTNGFLTDKIVPCVEFLLKSLPQTELALAISLDGPESVHDAMRGVPGSYARARDTVFSTAPFLKKCDRFSLRVSSVLCHENLETLEELMEETARWPVTYHDMGLVRDIPNRDQVVLAEKYLYLTDRQLSHAPKKYFRGVEWRLQRRVRDEILACLNSQGHVPRPCLAGSRLLEIFPDGSVRGCEIALMWEYSLLRDEFSGSLANISSSPAAKEFQKLAARCNCTFECAKGCNAVFCPSTWWRLLL